MKFEDFKDNPKDLIGRLVLNTIGRTFGANNRRVISYITGVTKTGFRVHKREGLYSLVDGKRKGTYELSYIDNCQLITESERDELIIEFALKAERKDLYSKIFNYFSSSESVKKISTEQMKEILLIIEKK